MSASFSTDKRRKIKKVFSIFLLFVFIVVNFFGFDINTAHAADAWWNVSWGYRMKITIDHTKVPNTDQANFPVLVSLSGLSHINTAGTDIRFTLPDGTTELARQIESYSGGSLVSWVKIPTLSHTADTVIYMYYGNSGASEPAATDADGSQHVWDDGTNNYFKAVYHLKDNAANKTVAESTSNGNTGASQQNTSLLTIGGKVGNALKFNGTSDSVDVAKNIGPVNSYTAEAWIKADALTGGGGEIPTYGYTVMASSIGVAGYPLWLTVKGTEVNVSSYDTAYPFSHITSGANLTTGNWFHIVIIATKGGNTQVFVNGVSKLSYTNPGTSSWNNEFTIGDLRLARAIYFSGVIDEVRVSNTVRSADWISTEYNNQSLSALAVPGANAFYTVASQEAVTVPDAPTGLTPTPGDTQVLLNWTAPADGGSPITDYVIDRKLHSAPDTDWATFSDGTSVNTYATVINLTNGSSYDFRVSAHNAIGTGNPSATQTATPATVPSTPAKGTATKGNASASVAFTPPQ